MPPAWFAVPPVASVAREFLKHRQLGNQAYRELLRALHRFQRLTVNRPGNRHHREANFLFLACHRDFADLAPFVEFAHRLCSNASARECQGPRPSYYHLTEHIFGTVHCTSCDYRFRFMVGLPSRRTPL